MIYPPEYLVMIPGPTNVPYRVMQAMLTPIINHRSDDFRVLYRRLQEKLKYTFQTENDIVVLTSSGTGAVEASVVNLIRKGDRAIIPVNGEFSERLAKMIELAGGEAIKVKAPYGKIPSFEQIKEAFDNNNGIKAFYVVYNETSTGTRITWLDRVKSLFARDDTFFVVDAVSNFAGDELPVDRWGVDICVTASQKCIAAPPGVAMLSLSERAKEYIKRDPPSTLYLEFARMGFEYFSDTECRSNTVIALKYPDGLDDKRFRSTLANEFKVLVAGGFGDMKGKLWRVGCMGEVNTYHVKRTLASVASTLDMLGVRLPAIAGK
jgi:aspartate aminotransferase-like enzyme